MKKVILFLMVVAFSFQVGYAQNMLHYALSSNGEKEWTLFPENSNGCSKEGREPAVGWMLSVSVPISFP